MKYKFTEEAKRIFKDNLVCGGEGIGYYNKYPNLDFTPKQGTPNSSGYDLSAAISEPVTLLANEEVKIGTGVHIWIGSDEMDIQEQNVKLAGFLMPRSSIKGCMLTNSVGLVDDDYQGEVIVSLWNRTDNPITIKPGQKLVQLVYVFTFLPVMELVGDFTINTVRGASSFGSTTPSTLSEEDKIKIDQEDYEAFLKDTSNDLPL